MIDNIIVAFLLFAIVVTGVADIASVIFGFDPELPKTILEKQKVLVAESSKTFTTVLAPVLQEVSRRLPVSEAPLQISATEGEKV